MSTPKNILVAIDFDPGSLAALKNASELARACEAKLSVLHVLALPAVRNIAAVPPAIEREAERSARRQLVSHTLEISNVSEILLKTGDPAKVIAEVAKQRGADLVVVGAHKRRGLARLLGDVARATVQRSPCPVLVHTEGKHSSAA